MKNTISEVLFNAFHQGVKNFRMLYHGHFFSSIQAVSMAEYIHCFPSLASKIKPHVAVQSKGRSSFAQTTAVKHLTGSVTRAHGLRFAVVNIPHILLMLNYLMLSSYALFYQAVCVRYTYDVLKKKKQKKRKGNTCNMNDILVLELGLTNLLLVGL